MPDGWRRRAARRLPHPRPADARLLARRRLSPPRRQAGSMVMGEETEREKLRAQLQAASEAFQGTAGRLLREGEMAPQLIVLAAAQVVGELGAGMTLAEGLDIQTTLDELAEVLRLAGRQFHEMLRAEALPTAGNA